MIKIIESFVERNTETGELTSYYIGQIVSGSPSWEAQMISENHAVNYQQGGGGGSGGVFKINLTYAEDQTITMDKTWQEIKDAYDDGMILQAIQAEYMAEGGYVGEEISILPVRTINYDTYNPSYTIGLLVPNGASMLFYTNTPNGYPVAGDDGGGGGGEDVPVS